MEGHTVDLDGLFARLAGIERLVARLRQINEDPYSPTKHKKQAESIARQIAALVTLLDETGPVQFDIECEYDRDPPSDIGPDGWPSRKDSWMPSYRHIVGGLKELESTARAVAGLYPDPRQRQLLPLASMALLHWRLVHDMPPPTFYDKSPAVQELISVLSLAGIYKDASTCRKYLSEAFDAFDPHYMPPHVRFVVTGRV